ncbi:Dicer-like protein 2 [Exophiala xenobiotica]|nr:Dicer-like protein 2 [Exophiala xenobiotica]KAK5332747.1 Dicer-like protein 2 [Exophiala xenobiotica]
MARWVLEAARHMSCVRLKENPFSAILRIKYEIERGPAGKIIWFLAPKVALCRQQYQTITNDIPAVSSILVVGEDNVDHWKDAHLWDAVFAHKIIVSTPAILRDALNRGFLTLEAISLLIFDEGMTESSALQRTEQCS